MKLTAPRETHHTATKLVTKDKGANSAEQTADLVLEGQRRSARDEAGGGGGTTHDRSVGGLQQGGLVLTLNFGVQSWEAVRDSENGLNQSKRDSDVLPDELRCRDNARHDTLVITN